MSSLLHKAADPYIDPEKPWDNDDFQRKEYGERLTRLVTNTPGSFVIALKAPWGAGKSIFLKRWEAHLELPATEDKPFVPVVHVDAWRDDYLDDPLTSFVVALGDRLKQDGKNRKTTGLIKKLAHGGARIIAPVARLAAAVGTGGGSEVAILSAETIEKVGEAWLRQSDAHNEGVEEFRNALASAREELCPKSELRAGTRPPLIFVVDELDRCRPDFAIKALERIKHFFGVDEVVFVVATDGDNLPSAVRTLYGPSVDGEQYLRKFFDYEFRLPAPTAEALCTHLFNSSGTAAAIAKQLSVDLSTAREQWKRGQFRKRALEREVQLLDIVETFSRVAPMLRLTARDAVQAVTTLIATASSSSPQTSLLGPFLTLATCLRYAHPHAMELVYSGQRSFSWIVAHNKDVDAKWRTVYESIEPLLSQADQLGWTIRYGMAQFESSKDAREKNLLGQRQSASHDDTRRKYALESLLAHSTAVGERSFDEQLRLLLMHALMFQESPVSRAAV